MIRPSLFALSTVALMITGTAFAHDVKPWQLTDAADGLKERSCEGAPTQSKFEPLPIEISPVALAPEGVIPSLSTSISFAGGWEIMSSNPDLGGLSGLAIEPSGDLLTVSDTGRFIRLGRTDGRLNGEAEIAPMQFENLLIKPGKLTSDAEGLTLRDGLTLVSYERDFRVLAFALDACGAAAKGVLVADPPNRYGLRPIRANAGPEALWMDPEGGLHILYEQLRGDEAQTAQITEDGKGHLAALSPPPNLAEGFRPVGADQIALSDTKTATVFLYRAYDRELGNRIRLDVMRSDQSEPHSVTLAQPLLVDNFEGVALEDIEDGLRAWIISDDNFSDRQRTLLYAFDVKDGSPTP
ncbi:MAG: esterase-like activity of phytase family protein [Pseudomonadota bacterium]